MTFISGHRSIWILSAASLLLTACGDDISSPRVGALWLNVHLDAYRDSTYKLTLDSILVLIQGNDGVGVVYSDVPAGQHTVTFVNPPSDCVVWNGIRQTVVVTPADTALAVFSVECKGDLRVRTETTGSEIEHNQFVATLGGTRDVGLAPNDQDGWPALVRGDYVVQLDGVASHCSVAGDNPRTITVRANEGADATFVVSCVPPPLPPLTGQIIYQSSEWRDGASDLYVFDGATGSTSRLTHDQNYNKEAHIGNDATIVFSRTHPRELTTMTLDGSQIVRVGTIEGVFDPAWSPDQTRIVYANDHPFIHHLPDSDLFVVNADGSGLTNLTQTPTIWESSPVWSPDGQLIAFHASESPGVPSNVYTMNPDGTDRILRFENAVQPDFSPDGTRLVFVRGAVWRGHLDGSGETQLMWISENNLSPTWSPDGTRISFVSSIDGNWSIYYMSAEDGTGVTRITDTTTWEDSPNWTP